MNDQHYNTIFWAIVTCLMWSTAYPFIKIGLQYSTPVHFAGTRFILVRTHDPAFYHKAAGVCQDDH